MNKLTTVNLSNERRMKLCNSRIFNRYNGKEKLTSEDRFINSSIENILLAFNQYKKVNKMN